MNRLLDWIFDHFWVAFVAFAVFALLVSYFLYFAPGAPCNGTITQVPVWCISR